MAAIGELYSFSEVFIENIRLSFVGNAANIVAIQLTTNEYGTEQIELDGNNNYELFLPDDDTIVVSLLLTSGSVEIFPSENYTFSPDLTVFTFLIPSIFGYSNKNNFIRWANTEDSDLQESELPDIIIEETDIRARKNPNFETLVYTPVIPENDQISWYFNSDDLISEPIGNLFLFFINEEGLRVSGNITGIQADVVSGSDYRPYLENLTIPDLGVSGACFRMVVATDSKVIMVSNFLKFVDNPFSYTRSTYKIRYRNGKDILNFGYEALPNYYNVVRIDLEKESPENASVETGYTLINGRFNTVRTTLNKSFNFVTGVFDGFAHDAMHGALIHSVFQLSENAGFNSYFLGENEYNQDEFIQGFPLTQANFRLTESGGSSNKAL